MTHLALVCFMYAIVKKKQKFEVAELTSMHTHVAAAAAAAPPGYTSSSPILISTKDEKALDSLEVSILRRHVQRSEVAISAGIHIDDCCFLAESRDDVGVATTAAA